MCGKCSKLVHVPFLSFNLCAFSYPCVLPRLMHFFFVRQMRDLFAAFGVPLTMNGDTSITGFL